MASKKGNEMLQHITPMYQDSNIEQAIYEAIGHEFDSAEELAQEVLLQLFPQTATWGLGFWEQRIGLATNTNEDINKRRRKIIAKMQTRYPINPENMSRIIKNYIMANTLIEENIAQYTFKVTSKIDDIADNRDLINIVNKIKPSHLHWIQDFITIFINKEIFNLNLVNRFFLNFRGNMPLILDGKWLLNGLNLLNGNMNFFEPIELSNTNRFFIYKKEILKSTITIEKNLWYLDGIYNLDGSKLLNAEIREEEL
ncbi:hypothetical protein CBCST_22805 (plasmid) [Clostridium botulinum C str. Stockholm]|nr:hypothetical protein CBCST_22805 [Clostridium botulinum C str. Stockholm]